MAPPLAIPIVSSALGAVGSFIGMNQQAKKQRAYERWIKKQQGKLDAWYGKESNTDYIDTAEGQSQYQGLRRMLKENTNRVDNTLIKTGATAESNLAAKEQANETLADATSQMAAQGTQRKNYLTSVYQNQSAKLRGLKSGNMQAGIEGGGNLASNGMGVLSNGLQSLFTELKTRK